jgi:carbamoyl-phosphate synthase large subunit
MKSVGEVMAIGATFPVAFQKALRGLETGFVGFGAPTTDDRRPTTDDRRPTDGPITRCRPSSVARRPSVD